MIEGRQTVAGDLNKLRARIDEIDAQILKLYEERMDVVTAIGKYKTENNLPVYDASREDAKLEKVFADVRNEEYADGAAQLFITLMQASRELQEMHAGEDDFNWDGEPVEINLEMLEGFGEEDA